MHLSYLLSLHFKATSLKEWATQLKIDPLYAILNGFEFDDITVVGTFNNFLNHIGNSEEDNLSTYIHPMKSSSKKPPAKRAK